MPVVALVVTLEPDEAQRTSTLQRLAADPLLSVGELHGVRLPLVAEGEDDQQTQATLRRVEATQGVVLMEVIAVDFSDVGTASTTGFGGRAHRGQPRGQDHGT